MKNQTGWCGTGAAARPERATLPLSGLQNARSTPRSLCRRTRTACQRFVHGAWVSSLCTSLGAHSQLFGVVFRQRRHIPKIRKPDQQDKHPDTITAQNHQRCVLLRSPEPTTRPLCQATGRFPPSREIPPLDTTWHTRCQDSNAPPTPAPRPPSAHPGPAGPQKGPTPASSSPVAHARGALTPY